MADFGTAPKSQQWKSGPGHSLKFAFSVAIFGCVGGKCSGRSWLGVPDTAGAFSAERWATLKGVLEASMIEKLDCGSAWTNFGADDWSWNGSVHYKKSFRVLVAMYLCSHSSSLPPPSAGVLFSVNRREPFPNTLWPFGAFGRSGNQDGSCTAPGVNSGHPGSRLDAAFLSIVHHPVNHRRVFE
jgi:hypothetical protein